MIVDLEDVRRRLDALQIPDDKLYSVRGVLSWSYAKLDAEAAHAFRMLGLFPGASIRVETAAALLDILPSEAADTLRSLAAQHLVEWTGNSYRMHDLTRIYAEEVCRTELTAASRRRYLERVLHWYVRTLTRYYTATGVVLPFAPETETAPPRLDDQRELVAWCTGEWDNIAPLPRTAQRIGCHEQVWRLAYLLFDYFYAAGQPKEWADTLRVGMRSAEMTGNRRAKAVLRSHLGVACSRMGQNDAAVDHLVRGLRLAEELGDDVLRTGLLGNLASTLREAKDYAAALPYATAALDLAHRVGLEYYEARCLDVLCELHAERGEFAESLRHGRRGLKAARGCRNALFEANILINLGVAEHGLDNTGRALWFFQDALALCASNGDRYHEALALFGLAKVHRTEADRRSAHDLASRALLRLRELDAVEVAAVTDFLHAVDADPRSAPEEDPGHRAG